jgi:hypothetical protein
MFNGTWKSNPSDYSRMDYFRIDGEKAEFVFGYGQTIYFHGYALLEYMKGNIMSIQYLKIDGVSTQGIVVPNIVKIHFAYVEESGSFDRDIVTESINYDRILRLDVDPFPRTCEFPYSKEKTYYRKSVV